MAYYSLNSPCHTSHVSGRGVWNTVQSQISQSPLGVSDALEVIRKSPLDFFKTIFLQWCIRLIKSDFLYNNPEKYETAGVCFQQCHNRRYYKVTLLTTLAARKTFFQCTFKKTVICICFFHIVYASFKMIYKIGYRLTNLVCKECTFLSNVFS